MIIMTRLWLLDPTSEAQTSKYLIVVFMCWLPVTNLNLCAQQILSPTDPAKTFKRFKGFIEFGIQILELD